MCRLRLRTDVAIGPLKLDHAADMFCWMQDLDVSTNLGLTQTPSLEKTREWIENALKGTSIWPHAILLNGRHVGNVILDQVDLHLECARLSVYIGASEARGSGVGLTGVYHALRECFFEHGLHKVWLTVHARNTRAIRTYAALRFQVEGVLRDGFMLSSERVPALYMGLLRDDFGKIEIE
jgi:RimJ/RimL family protein N-acetyltransferase